MQRGISATTLALVPLLAVLALALSSSGGGAAAAAAAIRHYYIAAEEVTWDYAPSGINGITGEPFGEDEDVFVGQGEDQIGRVYQKALYREYTNASFTTLKRGHRRGHTSERSVR